MMWAYLEKNGREKEDSSGKITSRAFFSKPIREEHNGLQIDVQKELRSLRKGSAETARHLFKKKNSTIGRFWPRRRFPWGIKSIFD